MLVRHLLFSMLNTFPVGSVSLYRFPSFVYRPSYRVIYLYRHCYSPLLSLRCVVLDLLPRNPSPRPLPRSPSRSLLYLTRKTCCFYSYSILGAPLVGHQRVSSRSHSIFHIMDLLPLPPPLPTFGADGCCFSRNTLIAISNHNSETKVVGLASIDESSK